MRFSIKNFTLKFPLKNPPANLVTFTEEIFNGKLDFLCSDTVNINVTHSALAKTTQHGTYSNQWNFQRKQIFIFSLISSKDAAR